MSGKTKIYTNDNPRSLAIAQVLNGLMALRIFYFDNRIGILSEAGACWSRDTIILEKGQLSDTAQSAVEHKLEEYLLQYLREDDDDYMSYMTTATYNLHIQWVKTGNWDYVCCGKK